MVTPTGKGEMMGAEEESGYEMMIQGRENKWNGKVKLEMGSGKWMEVGTEGNAGICEYGGGVVTCEGKVGE